MRIVSLLLQLVALVATAVLVFAFAGGTYYEMTGEKARLLPGIASVTFGLILVLQHLLPRPRTIARFVSLGAAFGLMILGVLEVRGVVVRGGNTYSLLLGVLSASLLPRGAEDSG